VGGRDLRQVLCDVAQGDVGHLRVPQAQLPQLLQPGLLVHQASGEEVSNALGSDGESEEVSSTWPGVPGGRQQLVDRRVSQVCNKTQVKLLQEMLSLQTLKVTF
jgi:hypothetical protein